MLSIEKYKSKEIDRIYREVYIDTAISNQAQIFEEMIKQGYMRKADPKIMALQFFAPIFLLLNRYDGIAEKEAEAIKILGKHIEQFDKIYREGGNKMKIAIIYATKYGCTKKCVEILKSYLQSDVKVFSAKNSKIDVSQYDTILIGGSVYMGKIQKEITRFCKHNLKQLLKKRVGLFVCCYTPNGINGFFETLFPLELLNHAFYVTCIGGEMNYDKMNFLYRRLQRCTKGT